MRFGNPSKKAKTVDTKVGHSIHFPGRPILDDKGKSHKDFKVPDGGVLKDGVIYMHVPDIAVPDVIAAGMEAEEDMPEKEEKVGPQRPANPAAVEEAVFDAFDAVIKNGSREDFTAGGMPTPTAMSKTLGWTVQGAELKDLFVKYQTMGKKD